MQEISSISRPRSMPPIAIFLIVILVVWGCSMAVLSLTDKTPRASVEMGAVNMLHYDRIQTGMTYAEVCQILGKPGAESARSEMIGIKTELYMWQGDGTANMTVMFQNGKMMMKAQFGLK